MNSPWIGRTTALLMLTFAFASGRAETIVDNLSRASGTGGAAGPNDWYAQGFETPPGTDFNLASVTLNLRRATTNQGTFAVSLWSGTTNQPPKARIFTLATNVNVATLDTVFRPYLFVPAVPTLLQADTGYFVVLEAGQGDSELLWADSAVFEPEFRGSGELAGWSRSSDQGKTWEEVTAAFPFQFAVSGEAVTAGPRISSPAMDGGTFTLNVATEAGHVYVVEYKDALKAGWQTLARFTGNGSVKTVTDTQTLATQRFYRVQKN